jgi:NAD+ kinase
MSSCCFHHVALVGKHQASGIRGLLENVARYLQQLGLKVSLEAQTALNSGLPVFGALSAEQIGQQCDVVIVLGGDGTMLGLARELAAFDIPLIGINQGRLGFITDVPIDQFAQALAPMMAGVFTEERRTMLGAQVWRHGKAIFEGFALNDVVVSRGVSAGMVELRVEIDGDFVANFRADGLIVGSPTGSTAYALSAGGPILHPGIAGFVLAPIAPHDLSNRPIVLPDSGEIHIEIVSGRDASVSFDTQSIASITRGDRITVRRSAHQTRFLHPKGWSYYATLRRKLHWNSGISEHKE